MTRINLRILYISLVSLLFTSCITSRKVNYMQPSGFKIPAYNDTLQYEDYQIRVGDRLYLRVFSTDNKTNTIFNAGSSNQMQMMNSGASSSTDLYSYLVQENGTIVLPMVNEVHIAGLTLREAIDVVDDAIAPYYSNSTVDLKILGRYFSVLGGGQSGFIPMSRDKINIFEALAMAGDVGLYGDRTKVRILRETPDGVKIMKFDIRSKDIINSEFYYIEPNDVIYIQEVDEKIFSITSLPNLFTTVVSTVSFGAFIYKTYTDFVKKETE